MFPLFFTPFFWSKSKVTLPVSPTARSMFRSAAWNAPCELCVYWCCDCEALARIRQSGSEPVCYICTVNLKKERGRLSAVWVCCVTCSFSTCLIQGWVWSWQNGEHQESHSVSGPRGLLPQGRRSGQEQGAHIGTSRPKVKRQSRL